MVTTVAPPSVQQPWVSFGVSSGLRLGLCLPLLSSKVTIVAEAIVTVNMGVSVRSVGVGERGVVISAIAIAMMSVQTTVVQPWVSLGICLSSGLRISLGSRLSFSLLPFRLYSRSLFSGSSSSGNRHISEVRSLSTGNKFPLAILAPCGRGSVH